MKKIFLGLVVFVSVKAFAAGAPTNCKVSVTDKKGKSVLSETFVAEVGEEELTTKTYVVRELKKVVTARVYFTDEWVGIKWGDATHDFSTTVRLDVEKRAQTGEFKAKDEGTQTRVLFSDWNNLKAVDVCNKALSDKEYAASIAPGGNLPVLLDSCRAYVLNLESNTLQVSKSEKGYTVTLTCTDQE